MYFHGLEDGSPKILPNKWRAILNLIFAIGAKYSDLTKAKWRGDDRHHLIYFTRARMLGLIFNKYRLPPCLPSISHPSIKLAGEHNFLLSGVSRLTPHPSAWLMSGFAVRCALALGLNLRNEDSVIGIVPKEIRVRVWWAVYSLESLLSVITGRPAAIVDERCTVSLPLP